MKHLVFLVLIATVGWNLIYLFPNGILANVIGPFHLSSPILEGCVNYLLSIAGFLFLRRN